MFQIIKTGQTKMHGLHYLELPQKGTSPPPPSLMVRTTFPGSGTKRQFVKVNEEVFVSEIKKRPILYNTTMKDHKRFSTRHEAWAEVAVAMNLSEQECKKRWRSLRDAFMKVVRNKSEEEQKTWIHYRLLEFLLPYIGKKGKRSREVECLEEFDNDDDDDAEYVEFEDSDEIYKGNREPITVSYVTEDGEEVFQMLQDPDSIPEGAVIGIEETEDEEEIEEENEILHSIHPSERLNEELTNANQDHPENFLYEERLDSTMLDIQQSYEMTEQQSYTQETVKQEIFSEIHVDELETDSVIEHLEEGRATPKSEKTERMNLEKPAIIEHTADRQESTTTIISENQHLPSTELAVFDQPLQQQASTALIQCNSSGRENTQANIVIPQDPTVKSGCSDSDERFLLSCAPILRRLPNKKNQLARLKIQQLLFELEYDEKYSS
ncbi:uncharacterized protein LOC131678236 [Topomyia yanbarensis]|uniref:uncharacterized protein LOC131678236 n=1 Tax=Topomyia yanbarensis TaxID=2498891 RepID=UPI00273B5DE5|nr:uncharacterized protein LOC131678236 [Topomyia yanbarensis]